MALGGVRGARQAAVKTMVPGARFVAVVICRGGRYTEEDAKVIVRQILSIVAFCHLQGVVHRDLKPEVRSCLQLNLN